MKHNSYNGLSDNEVIENRIKYGSNTLTPPKRKSPFLLYLEKFNDPVIKILLIAAIISLLIGFVHNEYSESVGIFIAVILATAIGFWFEYDANKKFDILNLVNEETFVKVIRNGKFTEVPKKDIVVGDIVILNTGDEIPADGKIIESVNLIVDESSLTGESMVLKYENVVQIKEESTYPSNKLFKGTKVTDGSAVMIVESVGDNTEYGKLAEKSAEQTNTKTPLNEQLENLAKVIGLIGFSVSVLLFITLFVKDIIIGKLMLSSHQLYLIIVSFIALTITLAKVWIPIISDGLQILLNKKLNSKICSLSNSWLKCFVWGIVFFVILIFLGSLFGINPLAKESWIDIDIASNLLDYFMVAVTIVVVSIPEGLPMSVTLSLALSMRRMLKSNNLVRKMHATETMGAVTVICTDKTGTLTMNQMTVYDAKFFAINRQTLLDDEISTLIKENIAINSTANLDFSDLLNPKPIGNPTEAALLKWLFSQNIDYLNIRNSADIIDQISFSTERKYMTTVVQSKSFDKNILYVKGAPEILYSLSKYVHSDKGIKDLNYIKQDFEDYLANNQSKAMRTLGFAYKILDNNVDSKQILKDNKLNIDDLVYLGLVAISDPVREDVPKAIIDCKSAGVRVIMVTGDTAGTAKEIARQTGIIEHKLLDNQILTGPQFEAMSDEEIIDLLPNLRILCRAKPTDKQRLVNLLKQSGEIVAVTGDGTNDAPALNHAHVGLAMGSGTAVAKEAGDITILDDSFSTIVSSIMWGRSLYKNIQKFIVFQLIINFTALVIVLVGSILGHEIPLTVTQMLWINLIMDTFAAGALASLPPDRKVLEEKPRKNSDFIITHKMKNTILFWGTIFIVTLFTLHHILKDKNGDINLYNLTVFFTVFVMMQFWNLFNIKAFGFNESAFKNLLKSKAFLLVSVIILIGQIIIVEFGGKIFRTTPLSFEDWILIIISTMPVLLLGEIIRFLRLGIK